MASGSWQVAAAYLNHQLDSAQPPRRVPRFHCKRKGRQVAQRTLRVVVQQLQPDEVHSSHSRDEIQFCLVTAEIFTQKLGNSGMQKHCESIQQTAHGNSHQLSSGECADCVARLSDFVFCARRRATCESKSRCDGSIDASVIWSAIGSSADCWPERSHTLSCMITLILQTETEREKDEQKHNYMTTT